MYIEEDGAKIVIVDDIADYAKDGRLTEPSDGNRYEWRKMIELVKKLSRPLTEKEAEDFRIKLDLVILDN